MKLAHLLFLLSLPVCALADSGLPSQPYIYVEGKAKIEKPPDIVTLRFDVVARDPDQPKANQQAQAVAGKVLALFNERKIAGSDVIAQDLRSEPDYEPNQTDGGKKNKIIGYTVTRTFAVKVHDLAGFPKLVNDLIGLGSIQFTSIEPGLSQEDASHAELSKKALVDARGRAEETAKSMGMKVDSVFAVSPVSFLDIQQQMFRTRTSGTAEAERYMIAPDPLQYRLAPVTLSESAHVIYLISPAT